MSKLPSWTLSDKLDDDGNPLPMFPSGHPPSQPSRTSEAAADSMVDAAEHLQCRVFDLLKNCPFGATDEEMQDALNMAGNTQRPRRVRLVEIGKVVDSGDTRKTQSGRAAVVWKVKR